MLKKIIFFLLLNFTVNTAFTQNGKLLPTQNNWADSVITTMTLDEKIGQLFMVAAYSNKDKNHVAQIDKLIKQYKIGGLIFFQGGPIRQANLTNRYQAESKIPLLISIDGEWGLAMRLDSTIKYPRQMALGAIQDNQLIYQMGADIAEQCKRMGIHVNLAPVVDVNNNPKNPVINSRSFGEDKENVAAKGIAYMKGLQDNGVMANAKHFPGHGDTDTDSHKALPVIKHSKERLENLELYPFKKIFAAGIKSVMVAHLSIPSLDSTKNQAATLSPKIVTGLLKTELGFKGLVFTDALNMKGVSSYFKPGIVDVKALLAGNDVLLFSENVPVAIVEIKSAINKGQISVKEIDARCKKILIAKQWVGLNKYESIKIKGLYKDLHQKKYEVLNRKLAAASITLLKNEKQIIPLKKLDTLKIASLIFGDLRPNVFQKNLEKYATITHFNIKKNVTPAEQMAILKKLKPYNLVLVGVSRTSESPRKNFGITQATIDMVTKLQEQSKVILTLFSNAYALQKFRNAEKSAGLIIAYHDRPYFEEYAAQLIFGGIKAKGKLSVSGSSFFPLNAGLETSEVIRLRYGIPEELNIDSKILNKIDSIAKIGIATKAFPGCQILVAKEGNVIYNKSFGYQTYEKKKPVNDSTIYDLASITKIVSTTLSLMKMADEGIINLDYNLCDYLPEWVDSTAYENMNLRDMLSHQAGLISWIPFYKKTLVNGKPPYKIYSLSKSDIYTNRVAENFYINKNYKDEILKRILGTKVNPRGKYKYSDLGYYFFQRIIEKYRRMPQNEYVDRAFYRPMGLSTLGYLPRHKFSLNRIAPTEYDLVFRKQLIHGDVHDPGAAMLGGVGGHAGVFSNANDLAKLMQMYVNGGTYGGVQYISYLTLKEFTKCQNCTDQPGQNRRGAGFDKPVRMGKGGPTCSCVSLNSFGHSGFTGTLTWADPDEKVVYVFLSNRVYPDAANKKLIKLGYRTQIMEVIYEAIEASK